MNQNTKKLLLVTIAGIGAGVLINKFLSDKSLSEIKGNIKNNIDKAKDIIKENITNKSDI